MVLFDLCVHVISVFTTVLWFIPWFCTISVFMSLVWLSRRFYSHPESQESLRPRSWSADPDPEWTRFPESPAPWRRRRPGPAWGGRRTPEPSSDSTGARNRSHTSHPATRRKKLKPWYHSNRRRTSQSQERVQFRAASTVLSPSSNINRTFNAL